MGEIDVNSEDHSTQDSHPSPSAPGFAVATQPTYANALFFGPQGLRPGWGLVFYVTSTLILQQFAAPLARAHNFGAQGLWSMMLEEFLSLVAAIIPAIVLARVERRPWKTYGLPIRKAFGRLFWIGAFWGFAGITLLMFALYGLRLFAFGHVILHGGRLLRFAAFWAVMFLLVGLFEEFLMRGYTLFTLSRGLGFWPSAVILSCSFGLIHLRNENEQWRGILAAACIGLFFCLTLRRTGSLWFAVGFHTVWDWGETYFYSVPDSGLIAPGHLLRSSLHGPDWLSGGPVGPEGSVLCYLIMVVLWFAFDRAYPKAVVPAEAPSTMEAAKVTNC